MSDLPPESRSPEPVEHADLVRLSGIGARVFAERLRPPLRSSAYRDRLELLCLCQGAALHLRQCEEGVPAEDRRGVGDFDLWGFFRAAPGANFPDRTVWHADFGPSRFGRREQDAPRFTGRKVDVIGRALVFEPDETAIEAVLRWVRSRGTSPGFIRRRPVYVLTPGPDFGRRIWRGTDP